MGLFDGIKKGFNKLIEPWQKKDENTNTQSTGAFCPHCGTKITSGAKFCSGCGQTIGTAQAQTPPPIINNNFQPVQSGRKEEYIGKVLKCSNCGSIITQTTAICPDCGMKITGQSAVNSVQAFKDEIMAIEIKRKKKVGGIWGEVKAADAVDVQKLTLIRNFPIPNTIDDIFEFVMLAETNIDISVSKNTWSNRRMGGSYETAQSIIKTISDAWVSKLKQAYQKAEIMFPNEPMFNQIQLIYFDKMKELKIKV